MGPEEKKSSESTPTGDVITQRELASQLIFQNVEYPHKLSLWERFRNGAQIEPGPLTIVQPYFDLGPFIIPTSDGTRRAEQIRQSIRNASLAIDDLRRDDSLSEFRLISQQITARAWQRVRETTEVSPGA